MTETASSSAPQNETNRSLHFSTKFGEITLREDRLISFPKGLLGPLFQDCTVFGLAQVPDAEDSALLLLQCINRPEYTFLVADPAALGHDLMADDKNRALRDLKLPKGQSQFLVILTLYDQEESYYLTANMRAPVIIDSVARVGYQHILLNKELSTQQKI